MIIILDMKNKYCIVLLTFIAFFSSARAQIKMPDLFPPDLEKGIEYYFTDDMKKSMATLCAHLNNKTTGYNPDVLLADVDRLFQSLEIREGKPSEEIIHISKKLTPFPEYYDLLAICHLTASNIFLQRKDSAAAESRYGSLYVIGSESESTLNRSAPSPIQKFMMAIADYLYEIPHNIPKVVMSNSGFPTRCSVMLRVVRSRSALRELCPLPITPSKCDIVNQLLLLNMHDLLHLNVSGGFQSATEQAYRRMCQTMDGYIAEWMNLQYPIEHLVYYIVNNKDDVSYSFKRERLHDRLLKELSLQGSGAASYHFANRLEEKKSKPEYDPQAIRRYYELSSQQGCAAGTMRLATCLTTGIGGRVDMQRAYSLLKPLIHHADFAKNGAFAYAVLLEKKIGGNPDLLDVMHYYATAADDALRGDECTTAREKCNQLYEKYYQ